MEGLKIGEIIVSVGTLNVEDGDYVEEATYEEETPSTTIQVPKTVPKLLPEEEKSL